MSTSVDSVHAFTKTAADLLAETFADEGISRVFLYPGGTIAPIVNACVKLGLELEVLKSEQGAGFAAIAAARVTGKPQIVLVTSGPGVTNVVTPIADAFYDSAPVVFVAGQISTVELASRPTVRQRGFQECPTVEMTRPISKWAYQITDVKSVGSTVRRAIRMTTEDRPGPVVLDFPMNIQQEEMATTSKATHTESTSGLARRGLQMPSESDLAEILDAIDRAERPVLLLGQGVKTSVSAHSLASLAEEMDALVVTSLPGVGSFDSSHHRYIGYIGHTGHWAANLAVNECDLLLVVGARLDLRQTGTEVAQFASQARIIWVDIDAAELNEPRVRVWKAVQGDAAEFVPALLLSATKLNRRLRHEHRTDTGWQEEIQAKRRLRLDDDPRAFPAGTLHPRDVLDAVAQQMRSRSNSGRLVVVTGVGLHQQWAARHLPYCPDRIEFLTSAGHGTMGFDLPAAIGASLAAPDSRVLCIVGDGSLLMNIQELAALAERKLDVKILVLNNRRLGIVSQFQLIRWGSDPSTGEFDGPDFSGVAEAFGVRSMRLEHYSDIQERIQWLWNQHGPALLEATIEPVVDVVPMLLAGQSMGEMWMGK